MDDTTELLIRIRMLIIIQLITIDKSVAGVALISHLELFCTTGRDKLTLNGIYSAPWQQHTTQTLKMAVMGLYLMI